MAFSSENLKVFLAVLDKGSFSAAARELQRVPSAVSMMIGQLEAELDLTLFDRSSREPVPTEAARALEPQARQVARHFQQLQTQALQLHQGLEKRLSLTIAPELLLTRWGEPLTVLATEFPQLEVEIRSAPQAEAVCLLHQGEVDLALVFERIGLDERESFQEFSSELMVPVIAPSHPLVNERSAPVRDVDLMDTRQIVVASGDLAGLDPRVVFSRQRWLTDSHLAALSLVQAGVGWANLPQTLVEPLLTAGTLQQVVLENMSNEFRLFVDVVWSRDRALGLGAQRYIELIRESVK